jgi:thiol:disulfide interchange protein DsbD
LLGGLILNLMPCVFPILAMKAAALSASAHETRVARRDGLLFLAGVLTTFLVLAGTLLALRAGGQAIGWGFQLQSPAVVASLTLLMLAVALNLAGAFEIGARLQGLGGSRLSRLPGGTGAFFTGVLAVVVAAPCTAPFMAFALGAALIMPAPAAMAVFLMLGLGLALPYLAISLSPGLLSRLPRPGPWMETLRRLLSLPMFAAALWLVWVFARQTDVAASLWLISACVAAALAAVALGRFASRGRGWVAAGWIGVALAVGMTGVSAAVAPADREGEQVLASGAWSQAKVEAALAQGRPVLVNFTADWCVSCKINERTALSSPKVEAAMTATRTLYLKADWTRRDDVIARELERHGRSGVPLYLLYRPGRSEPEILPQLLTEGLVVEALKK